MQSQCFHCSKLYGSIRRTVTNQFDGVDFMASICTCKLSLNNTERVVGNGVSEAYFKGEKIFPPCPSFYLAFPKWASKFNFSESKSNKGFLKMEQNLWLRGLYSGSCPTNTYKPTTLKMFYFKKCLVSPSK